MQILLFILIGFGITTIITKSELFAPLRAFLDTGGDKVSNNFFGFLIACPLCVGFWVGVFLSTMYGSLSYNHLVAENSFQSMAFFETIFYWITVGVSKIADGSLVGGIAWTIHSCLSYLDKRYELAEAQEAYYKSKEIYYDIKIQEADPRIYMDDPSQT